jgi:hypothetical protein
MGERVVNGLLLICVTALNLTAYIAPMQVVWARRVGTCAHAERLSTQRRDAEIYVKRESRIAKTLLVVPNPRGQKGVPTLQGFKQLVFIESLFDRS